MDDNSVHELALRMGDNCLILGQGLSAWCGHAPALEEDIALANIALDLIGQTKHWLGLAADLSSEKKTADDLAFLRDVREFKNCLLVEQSNGDYGNTLMRQFLFDAWHYPVLEALVKSSDKRIADIAEKSIKEVTYHLERSTDLVIRLGDGSAESNKRMQGALNRLWRYTGELTEPDSIDDALADSGVAPDLGEIRKKHTQYLAAALREAMLTIPDGEQMQSGGKRGLHTEGFGYLLGEMQVLQRSNPGAKW
ncbi:MAG: phenylacetate-CoA oxygenase subunit PaaC [Marinicaulis sp.]|nr:phenylacetate-CoA oxygenase subunit PaaC [Marinicaulis sp.]